MTMRNVFTMNGVSWCETRVPMGRVLVVGAKAIRPISLWDKGHPIVRKKYGESAICPKEGTLERRISS